MENRRILIDTSVFIEYFRKKKKEQTVLYNLYKKYKLTTSVICYFEFIAGSKEKDKDFVNTLFNEIEIITFDKTAAKKASKLYKELKLLNKLIDFRDLFIAATAIVNDMPLATLNIKHFDRINDLETITL